MNQNIDKLYKIAQKEERLIIGLMSGTSMDGLDVRVRCAEARGEAQWFSSNQPFTKRATKNPSMPPCAPQ
jgi:1,6-anhydro-N-acetylmuramate kinase